eukprot:403344352
MREYGLYIKEISPDGNCLFRAMSFFEDHSQDNHQKYRHKVVQYLRANQLEYIPIFENQSDLDDYIRMIEREHTWGGELELSILSKIYNCAFIIHANNRPDISVDSVEGENKNKKTYHLAYHLNEHYNCLLTLDDLEKMSEIKVGSEVGDGWLQNYGWIGSGMMLALVFYIGFKYFMVQYNDLKPQSLF